MANIVNSILDAMGTVADSSIPHQKYDVTIKATVLKVLGDNEYSCKYEGVNFTAIGITDTYEVDDVVYVTIPQNNWDLDKYIVFKVKKDLKLNLDPFKDFLNINNGNPDIFFNEKIGIIPNACTQQDSEIAIKDGSTYTYPNPEEETEYKLFDLSKQDEPFTRLGVSIQFSTNHIVKWNCNRGNYGLWIKIYQKGAEEEAVLFAIDTSDMLGNIYSAEGWYEYKKLFDISEKSLGFKVDENTCLKFFGMEDGKFQSYDDNLNLIYQEQQANPDDPDDNPNDYPRKIMMKYMKLYFGYAASDFYDGQIQLLCGSDLYYDYSWTTNPSLRPGLTKKLQWYLYEKNKNDYLIRKKIPVSGDRDNYVKVYCSLGGGGEFKEVKKVKPPYSSCSITITDTAEERIIYKIKYWQKNISFATEGDSPYISKESNSITFYRLNAPNVAEEMNSKMDKENPNGSGSFSINRALNSIIGENSVAAGESCAAAGKNAMAIGYNNKASGEAAVSLGQENETIGSTAISIGAKNVAGESFLGNGPIAIGGYNEAMGTNCPIAIGISNKSNGDSSIALGSLNKATGNNSVAIGANNNSSGQGSVALGKNCTASGGNSSVATGYYTVASGTSSHAEGEYTLASGEGSHAEGGYTEARDYYAHAEGLRTISSGTESHSEGYETIADGTAAHAEGVYTVANGVASHAEGIGTIAEGNAQHAFGKYNIKDNQEVYVEIVGKGSGSDNRSNARTLDWLGNEWLAGQLVLGTPADGGGNIIIHYKSGNTVHHIDVGATLSSLNYVPQS